MSVFSNGRAPVVAGSDGKERLVADMFGAGGVAEIRAAVDQVNIERCIQCVHRIHGFDYFWCGGIGVFLTPLGEPARVELGVYERPCNRQKVDQHGSGGGGGSSPIEFTSRRDDPLNVKTVAYSLFIKTGTEVDGRVRAINMSALDHILLGSVGGEVNNTFAEMALRKSSKFHWLINAYMWHKINDIVYAWCTDAVPKQCLQLPVIIASNLVNLEWISTFILCLKLEKYRSCSAISLMLFRL